MKNVMMSLTLIAVERHADLSGKFLFLLLHRKTKKWKHRWEQGGHPANMNVE
jgi:hypothetical protein